MKSAPCGTSVFLEPPYPPFHIEGFDPELGPARKLAWPNPTIASNTAAEGDLASADPLTQFKAWATKLEDGDDRNLGRLGLPPASEIKKLAVSPQIHGFILPKASTEILRALLDDQGIRSVKIADVANPPRNGQAGREAKTEPPEGKKRAAGASGRVSPRAPARPTPLHGRQGARSCPAVATHAPCGVNAGSS
jgi:hypothetical protein